MVTDITTPVRGYTLNPSSIASCELDDADANKLNEMMAGGYTT
jgi:hypothetical protein